MSRVNEYTCDGCKKIIRYSDHSKDVEVPREEITSFTRQQDGGKKWREFHFCGACLDTFFKFFHIEW